VRAVGCAVLFLAAAQPPTAATGAGEGAGGRCVLLAVLCCFWLRLNHPRRPLVQVRLEELCGRGVLTCCAAPQQPTAASGAVQTRWLSSAYIVDEALVLKVCLLR
jgi:hypothetical protein